MDLVVNILDSIGLRWQLVLTQLIGFLLAFIILRIFLFGKVQGVLTARAEEEKRREGAIAQAKKDLAGAAQALETRRSALEKQAYERAQTEVREGQKKKAEVVNAAAEAARKLALENRERLAKSRAGAADRRKREVADFTALIVQKVLDRKGDADAKLMALAEAEAQAAMDARAKLATGGVS